MRSENIDESLINLSLLYCTDYSKLHLKYLDAKVNFYSKQLQLLKEEKPFWFQKKKMKKYNDLINYYKREIVIVYKEMSDELNFIFDTDDIKL